MATAVLGKDRAQNRTSKRKHPVNPYLFYLAKRLAQYRYFGTRNPSDLEFVKAIYNKYKSSEFGLTTYIDAAIHRLKKDDQYITKEVKLDPYAKGMAKRIHKILKTKSLNFTDNMLDTLIKEISFTRLGKPREPRFASWKDFVKYFEQDRGCQEAEVLCRGRSFAELSNSEKKDIQDAAEIRCIKFITREPLAEGTIHSPYNFKTGDAKLIVNTESYTIETATYDDIYSIVVLIQLQKNAPILPRVDEIQRWSDMSKDFVYIYKDHENAWGYIVLLPVAVEWVEHLFASGLFNLNIEKWDIAQNGIYEEIKYILIKEFEANLSLAAAHLTFFLPLMLQSLIKENPDDFTLIYIADEEKEAKFLKQYGFVKTTTLMDEIEKEIKTVYTANGRNVVDMIVR